MARVLRSAAGALGGALRPAGTLHAEVPAAGRGTRRMQQARRGAFSVRPRL